MKLAVLMIAIVEVLIPSLVEATGSVRSEVEAARHAVPNAARGETLFSQCGSCHGPRGGGDASGSTPRIAGQHFRVVATALVEFRLGKRWDFRMESVARAHGLAGTQDIADVSAYVSQLDVTEVPGMGSGESTALGASIYGRRCLSCHGAEAAGDDSRSVPRLAGQHYGYLLRQMYDSVDGRRPALPRVHAARIAPLDYDDVRALADYLSRLGVPEVASRRPLTD